MRRVVAVNTAYKKILLVLDVLFSLPFFLAAGFVIFDTQNGWNELSRIIAWPVVILFLVLIGGAIGSWLHYRSAEVVLVIVIATFALLMCADSLIFMRTWSPRAENLYTPNWAWWELSAGVRGIGWACLNFWFFRRRREVEGPI